MKKKKSLSSERFRTIFNMHRIEKIKLLDDRVSRYKKKYLVKRRKLREKLNIREKVLVLVKRIKKRLVPGKFYKQSVQNIAYSNRGKTFLRRKKQRYIKLPIIGLKINKLIEILKKVSRGLNQSQ